MPGRTLPLVTGEVYHIFNRGIHRQPTFTNKGEYLRAIDALRFYKTVRPPVKLSRLLQLPREKRDEVKQIMKKQDSNVTIYSYTLMPNHFHLLIKQEVDGGISRYLGNFQNSYTRYFNTSHEIDGSLFLDQFKAVLVETDEQLIHVARYIHLNPYAAHIVKSLNDLKNYEWSSFSDYLKGESDFVDVRFILNFFKDSEDFAEFVCDQADYQRELKEKINTHLYLE